MESSGSKKLTLQAELGLGASPGLVYVLRTRTEVKRPCNRAYSQLMNERHAYMRMKRQFRTVAFKPTVPFVMLEMNTGEKHMLQRVGYIAEAIAWNVLAIKRESAY